ncbi:MAG: hypothetical protein DMG33_08415 [Acidobacteria bacterium]|nr:MAG: hypothetical protein DMG33_08415 [Acidobacteriota bacterium]
MRHRIANFTFRVSLLAVLVFFSFRSPLRGQTQAPSAYAITHAKIFTLAGAAIEDGTVVIRDGKIAAVGAQAEVPAGAQVIDAKGLQVYPGLFDPVTQMGLSEIAAVNAPWTWPKRDPITLMSSQPRRFFRRASTFR